MKLEEIKHQVRQALAEQRANSGSALELSSYDEAIAQAIEIGYKTAINETRDEVKTLFKKFHSVSVSETQAHSHIMKVLRKQGHNSAINQVLSLLDKLTPDKT